MSSLHPDPGPLSRSADLPIDTKIFCKIRVCSITRVEYGKSLITGAQLRPADHINSGSVLCSNNEAIFESLPLDLLLDQLLEALFVIHRGLLQSAFQ